MATEIPTNTARFDAASLARVLGVDVPSVVGSCVGVSTDSRRLERGNLFVAIRGEAFDGHRFAASALERGAAAVLVSDPSSVPDGARAIVVPDTLTALGTLGRAYRERFRGRVVAITGSAGKTTTKELVRAAVSACGRRASATVGNLNNRIGVPMTLFTLDAEGSRADDVAVVEMGTSFAGEIDELARIGRPDVSMITSIGLSHAAGIGSEEDVAVEKGGIFRGLPDGGTAVVLADDPRTARYVRATHRVVRYGRADSADVRVGPVEVFADGARAELTAFGSRASLFVPIPSAVACVNAAGAIAVGLALGCALEPLLEGIASTPGVDGRMRPIPLPGGALLLDDTYNANPKSVLASLEAAAALAQRRGGALHVLLGDMKELGASSLEAHAEVGRAVVAHGAAFFLAVGADMSAAADVAEAHVPVARAADARTASLPERLGATDVVLVKGSRSMRMESLVERLRDGEVHP